MKIKYTIIKRLERIGCKEQKLEDLVKVDYYTAKDKTEAIDYVLEHSRPGVWFEIRYITDEKLSPDKTYEENLAVLSTAGVESFWCDNFLQENMEVDKNRLKAELLARLP